MTVQVGTCSWTGRSLLQSGKFYGISNPTPEQMLRRYSSIYPTVEVDSTFYALPSQRNAELWVERTPASFLFHLKAFSLFTTHGTPAQRLPGDIVGSLAGPGLSKRNLYPEDMSREAEAELWHRYMDAIQPLKEAGKLGFILLQFPPRFIPSRENAQYLLACQERLRGYQVAVEFRHKDWFQGRLRQRTPEFLRENGLAMVCVDMLQGFDSSIPPLAEATAKESYLRLHGRNAATWEQQGAKLGNRHDYQYTEEELEEWIPHIHKLEGESERVHVLFNTVQALETAQMMQNMIAQEKELN